MSLLEWSPTTNSIVTVSIHYYERDEYKVQKAHDGKESQLLIGRSFCRKSSWAIPTQLISTLIHNNDAQYSTFMATNLLFFLFVNRISWTHPTKITIKSKSSTLHHSSLTMVNVENGHIHQVSWLISSRLTSESRMWLIWRFLVTIMNPLWPSFSKQSLHGLGKRLIHHVICIYILM